MELAPDFDEFIGSLTAHGVEFVVVGAYALAFHGAPRFTGDLDILVRPALDNASSGARRARGVRVSRLRAESRSDSGPSSDAADGRAAGADPRDERHQRSRVGRGLVRSRRRSPGQAQRSTFLGRETFLRNKRAAGRPKDLADIDALEPGHE